MEEKESPNGNLTGLSALLNQLPPWAMHVIIALAGVAVLVKVIAKAAPLLMPPGVGDAADAVLAVLVPVAIASSGARK